MRSGLLLHRTPGARVAEGFPPPAPIRCDAPGAEIDLLLLSVGATSCVAVDLESGALLRAHFPAPMGDVQPLDVATARLAAGAPEALPEAPETVYFAEPPTAIGHLRARRAARLLRPLLHPRHRPILGLVGSAAPFWQFEGDRPSVAVVEPDQPPAARMAPTGLRCWFRWGTHVVDLPLHDHHLMRRLEWSGPRRSPAGLPLAELLGYRPRHVVVELSRPVDGYCYKVATGLLPAT